MSDDLVQIARSRIDDTQRTHWEGCERDHRECLIQRMADEIERLRATLERQQLISYEREREIDQEEIERLIALRRGDAEILERMRAELAEAVTALPQAIRNERERCAKIIEDMVRAVDGADALAAIRGA